MGTEFKNRLSKMQENWKTGKDKAPGVPDGVYNLQLQGAELKESQASGKLMIACEHLVLDGEHAGEVIRDYMPLENDFGPRKVAQFIETMGYEAPESAEDIEDIIAEIANAAPCYSAQVKKAKDGDLRNVNIRQLIDAPDAAPAPKAKAATKAKAAAKAPIKKAEPEAEPDEAPGFSVGDEVSFKNGEETMTGKIVEVTDTGFNVEVEGGDVFSMEEHELEGAGEPADESEAEDPEASEDTAELLAFCQSHEIECSEDMSKEDLITLIQRYEFPAEELTPEETKLLEDIGGTITAPAKKAAPKKAPVAAKKTPAPAPKKAPAKATPKAALKKKK